MPRMSKKRRLEWSFFLNHRNRITYNDLCRGCTHGCKQSFRAIIVLCPRYFSKRWKHREDTANGRYNSAVIAAESKRCDALLSDIDGKNLDPQQRAVVLCNEKRMLVLAGAGSGKTLTIAGKVKYLCQEKGVSPEDILLIAFTVPMRFML